MAAVSLGLSPPSSPRQDDDGDDFFLAEGDEDDDGSDGEDADGADWEEGEGGAGAGRGGEEARDTDCAQGRFGVLSLALHPALARVAPRGLRRASII